MDPKTSLLFAQQLAHWADSYIQQGRFPFRKIETFPTLFTAGGEKSPPLILWINKDSFMAGGLILFPPKGPEDLNDMGRDCAEALGLRHFVAWAPREIVFWHIGQTTISRHKTITLHLQNTSDKETFHEALALVLDEIKILSVTAATAPTQLSPYYLVNLWHGALKSSYPFILENYLMTRGESRPESPLATAEFVAYHKTTLALLRLVALIAHDRLPSTIQPEGLERAAFFALESLPACLQNALKPAEDELALPSEACTRFHHFFRRMLQLPQRKDPECMSQVLQILLQQDFRRLGGQPLPVLHQDCGTAPLLINPDREYSFPARVMEVAPQAILAYTSLQRNLKNQPECWAQETRVLHFSPPTPPTAILGTLFDPSLLSMQQRNKMAARLRGSWPNRRFHLPPSTPYWAWEFIHLLGIAKEGASLEVNLPNSWLFQDFGSTLFELLVEQFTICSLTPGAEETLRFEAKKVTEGNTSTAFILPTGTRSMNWGAICKSHKSLLSLALCLPDSIYPLLENGSLHIPTESTWMADLERDIFLFTRSTLGRNLWETLGSPTPLPPQKDLKAVLLSKGMPVPKREVLSRLSSIPWQEGDSIPKGALDSELSLWLQDMQKMDIAAWLPKTTRSRKIHRVKKVSTQRSLGEGVAESVFRDGVPQFPEHYLYDYYKPKLKHFHWHAPLRSDEGFLGRYTLQDNLGTILEVEGPETAQALVLISCSSRKSAALPEDRHLTATILERYISDLKGLLQSLSQKVHRQVADPKEADKLIQSIWAAHGLPTKELFTDQ